MAVAALPISHSKGCGVTKEAQERLRAVLYLPSRDLHCEYRHGLLILRGRVGSYYEKQLAQEAVIKLEGVTQVMNELEVTWSDS
jgi:osmotically-inducible protein OsmY